MTSLEQVNTSASFNYFPSALPEQPRLLDWQNDALCAQTDPDAFFPEKGGSSRDAKRICVECDVQQQCLVYALVNEEHFGILGGLSEQERRKLRKSELVKSGYDYETVAQEAVTAMRKRQEARAKRETAQRVKQGIAKQAISA